MHGIVVGVSDSATGAAALDWALQQAVLRQVPLTAVRAWEIPAYGPYYSVGAALRSTSPDFELTEQRIAQDALDAACGRVPGAGTVQTSAVASRGRPSQVLVDDAAQAELLVVGTRGVGALSRLVHLGSVTSSVLHHATRPVAVVPESATITRATSRVVVGVDDSPRSRPALAWAVDHARLLGAVLVPVKVRGEEHRRDDAEVAGLDAATREELTAAAAGADPREHEPLEVSPEVRVGHTSSELIDAAGQDTLVMGTRGRGGFASLILGSTTHQVAGYAHGPVVVVRSG